MKPIFKKTNLICIKSGASVQEARELMREKRIRHLPVLGDNDDIIGMLSSHDLSNTSDIKDYPVEMLARKPVIFLTYSTPLRQVALKMIEEKISSVLLTDDHWNVTGIITTDDLLYHLANILNDENETVEREWTGTDSLITAGEFSRRLSDIGI